MSSSNRGNYSVQSLGHNEIPGIHYSVRTRPVSYRVGLPIHRPVDFSCNAYISTYSVSIKQFDRNVCSRDEMHPPAILEPLPRSVPKSHFKCHLESS